MGTAYNKPTSDKRVEATNTNSAHGLRDLFEFGLKDIYWAEKVLSKTLPKMVRNASSPELVSNLKKQLTETEKHVTRLEEIFKSSGIEPTAKKCDAMAGIIKESNNMLKDTDIGVVRDAGIIAAEQKVIHYEIATYGTLHAFAKTLGETKAAKLLAKTLKEDKEADASFTDIALKAINNKASRAAAIANIRM
ncbi:ferritin-like domain-containing protein [Flavobacterium sp. K5-23]|uniref:YciE/YciF ferroxidase family protein n=1 Tax=Flavobacterium sp. K5-23 TaxID=2746225 RepID=UPI00200E8D81|nr:ferritin-like domain-containing protein [Flavobacterium sp. K5-23]UQD57584.1 ferritin-like domain-containing protein [Flavobacterium sp. K5-23]